MVAVDKGTPLALQSLLPFFVSTSIKFGLFVDPAANDTECTNREKKESYADYVNPKHICSLFNYRNDKKIGKNFGKILTNNMNLYELTFFLGLNVIEA